MRVDQLKRLIFFWVTSFATATIGFYLLWFVMPGHYVFGTWFRMFTYHYQHPIQYIIIPCFFFGFIAKLFADKFYKQKTTKQILTTLIIATLTIIISLPFGGMLWNFHDMQAGYFPSDWTSKMIRQGIGMGLSAGWLIVVLSFPYNLLGLVACFFLTRTGAKLFRTNGKHESGIQQVVLRHGG